METKTYTIPLRREFLKTSRNRRAKKAITGIHDFVEKHIKAARIIIGEELNELVWANGISNPPPRVKVDITKDVVKEDDKEFIEAYVNLVGIKRKKKVELKKKGVLEKQNLKDKLSGAMSDLKGSGESESPAEKDSDDTSSAKKDALDTKSTSTTAATSTTPSAKKETKKDDGEESKSVAKTEKPSATKESGDSKSKVAVEKKDSPKTE